MNYQTLNDLLDLIAVIDIPEFLNFTSSLMKSRDYIIPEDIPNMIKSNKCYLSESLFTSFFNKISTSQVGNLLYINMDLYNITISRLDQAIELDNLKKKNAFKTINQNNTGSKILDDIINNQEECSASLLIIQGISIDVKRLFEQLIQSYNRIVKHEEGKTFIFEQINIGIEETFKKLKDIEIYNKKIENCNISNTNKLSSFKEKYQFLESFYDHAESHKKVSSNQLIDLSPITKNNENKDNEYIIKLLKDIDVLEENQHNLEHDYENLTRILKEKENKLFVISEENNLNLLEIKKQRLEIQQINDKLNAANSENEILLKKTYKAI